VIDEVPDGPLGLTRGFAISRCYVIAGVLGAKHNPSNGGNACPRELAEVFFTFISEGIALIDRDPVK